MANVAINDQKKRLVEVARIKLVSSLLTNLENHIVDYKEAMAGYKGALYAKAQTAFVSAKEKLIAKEIKVLDEISALSDSDIVKQRDYITLIDSVSVEMKVPHSYEEEYKAAIDMFEWDVRETIELTYAEFTCFVRDQWDWKAGFEEISRLYKA